MSARRERNCQIRMSSSLWNEVGDVAHDLGRIDARGRHSAVIRDMVAASTSMWIHSPYVCLSAQYMVYVTKHGDIFLRQVQILRLNTAREKLPYAFEMKPEKRDQYHRQYRRAPLKKTRGIDRADEFQWFLSRWLINCFSVWSGKKNADNLDSFQTTPLSTYTDTFGTTSKYVDLPIRSIGGRFLTREAVIGLRDYVQWREPDTPIFDRIDVPVDIPTAHLEISLVIDSDLFSNTGIEADEIANVALEFRNRESARFEGKEVALYSESRFESLYGRSPDDEGADELLRDCRRLRHRVSTILSRDKNFAEVEGASLLEALRLPHDFLFYRLRWPSPTIGIEACLRWEKPVKRNE